MSMDKTALQRTHPEYDAHINDWNLYSLAYTGGRQFIEYALDQIERETTDNYNDRIKEGVCLNFSKAIADLFNFYLTEKAAIRELGLLEADRQWQMFMRDADFHGTDFDTFMIESSRLSAINGSLGILVTKPDVGAQNISEEIANNIYPYCCAYTLQHILDWRFGKNSANGRPQLQYIKLREDDNRYLIWDLDHWELWSVGEKDQVILEDEGINPLDEIPFLWFPSTRNLVSPYLGQSDIAEISRIQLSLTRNISCGEEIIKWSGFPMMRKPMLAEGEDEKEDVVGNTAIQEFNPEFGEAGKPDWMPTEVLEPISSILSWIDRKIDETYRIAHLSGVHGQRKSNNEVASGLALRYEFQQLYSVLSKKAESLVETEYNIIRLWLKWQKKSDWFENIKIKRSKLFSVDDLAISLDNQIRTIEAVPSQTFKRLAQQHMVKQMLPDIGDAEMKQIEAELMVTTTPADVAGNNSNDPIDSGPDSNYRQLSPPPDTEDL